MRTTHVEGQTRQPERVIVGLCPECGRVVIVENHHETWPLVTCQCGWVDDTDAIVHRARFEHQWRYTDV